MLSFLLKSLNIEYFKRICHKIFYYIFFTQVRFSEYVHIFSQIQALLSIKDFVQLIYSQNHITKIPFKVLVSSIGPISYSSCFADGKAEWKESGLIKKVSSASSSETRSRPCHRPINNVLPPVRSPLSGLGTFKFCSNCFTMSGSRFLCGFTETIRMRLSGQPTAIKNAFRNQFRKLPVLQSSDGEEEEAEEKSAKLMR
jgi:hypothetical protein